MADVTVDELSIQIAVKADAAAEKVRELTTALSGMVAALTPALKVMKEASITLSAFKGAAPAINAMRKIGLEANQSKLSVKELIRQTQGMLGSFDASAKGARTDFAIINSNIASATQKLRQMKLEADDANSPAIDALSADIDDLRNKADRAKNSMKLLKASTSGISMASPVGSLGTSKVGTKTSGLSVAAKGAVESFSASSNAAQQLMYSIVPGTQAAETQIRELNALLGRLQSQLVAVRTSGAQAFNPAFTAGMENDLLKIRARYESIVLAQKQFSHEITTVPPKIKRTRAAVDQLTAALHRMSTRGKKSTSLLGNSFIQLRSKIFFAFFAIAAVTRAFQVTIGAASDYVETLNLFQVALRNNRVEADAFVESMQRAFGLDPKRIMEYQGTFFQIAESMGVANENAYALSEVLTRLTFDLSSLRNMDLDVVFTKMQAILTGQDRAIRSLGGSIQMSTLAELANSLGIQKNIASMTQAEKVLLRMIAYYRQSAIAQQDMARTLTQPANLMRVLKDQVAIAARNIGALFIPALKAVLPWLIFVANAIGNLAAKIASVFGIELSSAAADLSDISFDSGGMSEGFDDVAESAGAATKALRQYTMGFDELNVISSAQSSGGGGGGGGGGGMGDLNTLISAMMAEMDAAMTQPFQDMMDSMRVKMDALLKVFEPLISAVKRFWNALKPFAANVWEGFRSFWVDTFMPALKEKLNTDVVDFIDKLTAALNWFNEHPETTENIGKAFGIFTLILPFVKPVVAIIKIVLGLIGGLTSIVTTGMMVASTIGAVYSAFAVGGAGAGFSALMTAIGPTGWIVLGLAAIVAVGALVVKNWDTIKRVGTEVWDKLKPKFDKVKQAWERLWNKMKPGLDELVRIWNTKIKPIVDAIVDSAITLTIDGIVAGISGLLDVLTGVLDILSGIWDAGIGLLTLDFGKVKEGLEEIGEGGDTIVDGIGTAITDALSVEKITEALKKLFSKAFTKISEYLEDPQKITDAIEKAAKKIHLIPILNHLTHDLNTWSAKQIANIPVKLEEWRTELVDWFDEKKTTLSDSFETWFEDLVGWEDKEKPSQKFGTKITENISEGIAQKSKEPSFIRKLGQTIVNLLGAAIIAVNVAIIAVGIEIVTRLVGGLVRGGAQIAIWASRIPQTIITAISHTSLFQIGFNLINTLWKGMRSKWTEIETWLKNLFRGLLTLFGGPSSSSITNRRLSGAGGAASGGILQGGQMFVAGEYGRAELLGNYRGSTTVMPLENSGFVEAMASAVYSATVAAMGSRDRSDGSGDVYIDGVKAGQIIANSMRKAGLVTT